MAGTARQAAEAATSIVPANEASWEDLRAVFGPHPGRVVMRFEFRPGP